MLVVPNERFSLSAMLPSTLDVEKVGFSDVKSNSYGSKFTWVNYDNGPFLLDVPAMYIPFGINKYVPTGDDSGYAKYSVDISFRNADEDPEVAALKDFLEGLDDKLVDEGCSNSLAWFKKKSSHEM